MPVRAAIAVRAAAFAAIALPILAAFQVPAAPAAAASFNCRLATTPTERTICNTPQLSTLDDQTAGLYFQIIGSGAPAATIASVKAAQITFLGQRNACGTGFDCMVSAYTAQIMYLRNVKESLGL